MEQTGTTDAAAERGSLEMQSRLEHIESTAKRLCTAVREEVTTLATMQSKVAAASKAADDKTAAADANAKAAHEAAAAEVQAEKTALQAERDAMKDVQSFPTVIELDVGGTRFKTSRSTLCRCGGFLEAMFSGRHRVEAAADGSYFIDRDPTHFRLILNFLRTGAAITPEAPAARAEAAAEAAFYALATLQRALTAPPLDMETLLSPDLLRMRRAESEIRARFLAEDGRPSLHEGLRSLFEGGADAIAASLVYSPEQDGFPLLLQKLARQHHWRTSNWQGQVASGTRVAVPSLEEWRTNFNKLHPNMLNRLAPLLAGGKVLVAGGSVLHALTHGDSCLLGGAVPELGDKYGPSSDIDLFLHTCTPAEASSLAKGIYDAVAADEERWSISRGRGVITLVQHVSRHEGMTTQLHGRRHCSVLQTVQIVLRLYDSPAEVLLGFDVDCASVAYDGADVWALPRAVRALKTCTNVLNPLHAWPVRAAYEFRLAKYAWRGYAVVVPGLDFAKVDHERIRDNDLSKLSGLARLLRISNAVEYGKVHTSARAFGHQMPQVLAYNLELRPSFLNALSPEDRLVLMGGSNYDDEDVTDGISVFLPSCFPRTEGEWSMGDAMMGSWPRARETRGEAWAEILDCGDEGGSVPRILHRTRGTRRSGRAST